MQNNNKHYSFLLTHRSKNRIYFKRVEISKASVHFGTLGIVLLVGIISLGIGVRALFGDRVISNSVQASVAADLSADQTKQREVINYARPLPSENLARNSGGPDSAEETDGENDTALEAEIDLIRMNLPEANLPNKWAHLGKINNEFGFRRNPFGGRSYEFHAGMDIDGERGDEVFAPAGGTVVKAGWSGGYGNMIEIDHGMGLTTRYGHLSKVNVEVGDTVSRDQVIGLIGSTGRSTGPHLHYEFRLHDRSINPRHFLPPEPTELSAAAK